MKTNRFSESFANADAVFNDMYGVELKLLKGLSKEEIDAIIPASNSMQTYQALVEVVEKASKNNLAQAQLISKIKDQRLNWPKRYLAGLHYFSIKRSVKKSATQERFSAGINPPALFGLEIKFKSNG